MLRWVMPSKTTATEQVEETSPMNGVISDLEWWNIYQNAVSQALPLDQVKQLWNKNHIRQIKETQISVVDAFFSKMIELLKMSTSPSGANHLQISIAATSLSLIIPRLLEDPQFEQKYFWTSDEESIPPRGAALLDAILAILLQPGFTLPDGGDDQSHGALLEIPSSPSSSSSASQPAGVTEAMLLRQAELVNLLLIFISASLFIPYDEYSEVEHKWMTHLTHCSASATLFRYLTRTVFAYQVPQARLGFFRHTYQPRVQDSLARSCFHLWILLMNYGTDRIGNSKPQDTITQTEVCNPWWKLLNECDDHQNAWMLNQMKQNLENSLINMHRSIPQADFSQECVLSLWILLTMHCEFYNKFGEDETLSLSVLVMILENLLATPVLESTTTTAAERSPKRLVPELGTTNMLAFTLLVMSTRRAFAVSLNEPLVVPSSMKCVKALKVPMKTYADLLVTVIHSIISHETKHSSDGKMSSWCELLIIILSNTSAFVKSFSLESSVMLVNLLEKLTRPTALPQTRNQVNLLLGVFNNVLQYQYEGNASLLYVILRENAVFRKLIDASAASGSQQTTPSDVPNSPSMVPYVKSASANGGKFRTEHIEKVLTYLLPKVEAYCQNQGLNNHAQVLEYLAKTTLVGILPVPHKILVRNFLSSRDAATWIISYIWGLIFMKNDFLEWLPYDTEHVQMIVFNN